MLQPNQPVQIDLPTQIRLCYIWAWAMGMSPNRGTHRHNSSPLLDFSFNHCEQGTSTRLKLAIRQWLWLKLRLLEVSKGEWGKL